MESVETKYIVILMALCTSFMVFVGIVSFLDTQSQEVHANTLIVETSGIMG